MIIKSKNITASYLRNFVFGVEDSLVSTVGLLSGIAIAGIETKEIILTGLVLIFVEAFSMGSGSFLSEYSAEEFIEKKETSPSSSFLNALIMFISYFISGFIPLAPYLFTPPSSAFFLSIALSLATLFLLGIFGAFVSKTNFLKNGLRMLIIGGIAIAVGIAAGKIANQIKF